MSENLLMCHILNLKIRLDRFTDAFIIFFYTTMSSNSISQNDQTISILVAEARALRFALVHNAVTYGEAKTRAEAILQKVNEAGEEIAKKHGRKYRMIKFSDL